MRATSASLLALIAAAAASAQPPQSTLSPPGNSRPAATAAFVDTIPPARDIPFPGAMTLAVDATDTMRGIFRVSQTVPVPHAGDFVLLYPRWIPGAHRPSASIDKVAGLIVTAGGRVLPWKRDPVDVAAFHIAVPAGVTSVDVTFQFLSATAANQGRTVMTPDMLDLQWISLSLYPAGYYVRDIAVDASVTYPAGFKAATALRPVAGGTGGATVRYGRVAYDVLLDSPVFAGRYSRVEQLSPDVTLNMFADRPEQLKATPDQLAAHRRLVEQAIKLFGAQHYDHYDFLFALSDQQSGVGLEHHRSSEDGTGGDYFIGWETGQAQRDLLPHEFTHSWNGKFRRGADLWTPDYRTPMRDSLLWVYEGQTQFWGNVLAARAGLVSPQDALDALAIVAAYYDNHPRTTWRPLIDTTNDPVISSRAPKAWTSYQGSEDYYREGQMVWLDVDQLIRERSAGKRSIDDFARAFFGVRDRDYGELTYMLDDVVATLNRIEPYGWAAFLHDRLDQTATRGPLDGIARGGYRLIYTDENTAYGKSVEKVRKGTDFTYSLGLGLGSEGAVTSVLWDGPAFQAGIRIGDTLVAIDGHAFATDLLKETITVAKGRTAPIRLLVKSGDTYRDAAIAYNGGLRYPHLEKVAKGPAGLDALYAARR